MVTPRFAIDPIASAAPFSKICSFRTLRQLLRARRQFGRSNGAAPGPTHVRDGRQHASALRHACRQLPGLLPSGDATAAPDARDLRHGPRRSADLQMDAHGAWNGRYFCIFVDQRNKYKIYSDKNLKNLTFKN